MVHLTNFTPLTSYQIIVSSIDFCSTNLWGGNWLLKIKTWICIRSFVAHAKYHGFYIFTFLSLLELLEAA